MKKLIKKFSSNFRTRNLEHIRPNIETIQQFAQKSFQDLLIDLLTLQIFHGWSTTMKNFIA